MSFDPSSWDQGSFDSGSFDFGVGAAVDPFSFVDQSGIAFGATVTSAAVTITGIDTTVLAVATNGLIDVNGDGNFQASHTLVEGDAIRARHVAPSSYSAVTQTVVDIEGVSGTFTSVTIVDPDAKKSAFTRLGFGFGF